ncbi:MAG: hypothetical protein R3Y46_05925 [Opitutales bacterium]
MVNREYENGEKKEKGLYANTTVRFDGFEPNKDYTIAIEAEYKYTDKDGKTQTENVLVFYDMKSDKDGTIIAERVAALACNDENISINEAEVTLNFYSLEGRVSDNYDTSSPYVKNPNGDASNLNDSNNKSAAHSLISHAKSGKYDDNGNIQADNQACAINETSVSIECENYTTLASLRIKAKR